MIYSQSKLLDEKSISQYESFMTDKKTTDPGSKSKDGGGR